MDEVIKAALSADNAVRRRAEDRLKIGSAQRGYAVALANILNINEGAPACDSPGTAAATGESRQAEDPVSLPKRLMAGMLLQHFVRDSWERANNGLLPPEDKAQVRLLF